MYNPGLQLYMSLFRNTAELYNKKRAKKNTKSRQWNKGPYSKQSPWPYFCRHFGHRCFNVLLFAAKFTGVQVYDPPKKFKFKIEVGIYGR